MSQRMTVLQQFLSAMRVFIYDSREHRLPRRWKAKAQLRMSQGIENAIFIHSARNSPASVVIANPILILCTGCRYRLLVETLSLDLVEPEGCQL